MREEIEKFYCDFCGESIDNYISGYHNVVFGDNQNIQKDICQFCQEKLITFLLERNEYYLENNPKQKLVLKKEARK